MPIKTRGRGVKKARNGEIRAVNAVNADVTPDAQPGGHWKQPFSRRPPATLKPRR